MKAHIYLRASTKDQDADRAKVQVLEFASNSGFQVAGVYSENISGTKLQRPQLMELLAVADPGDVLLVESIDRLSRLSQSDWARLKQILAEKQLRLIVVDLPTTHLQADTSITGQIMAVINDMLIDLTSTMARLDQEKRVERIRQGMANKRAQDPAWTPPGKQKNVELWQSIERLLIKLPNASVDEIAKLASCGVATVYRVKKSIKDRNERNSE
ncbi:recombinase family protein [Pseudomonas sp. WS 5010]|uniref:recombinase family protein n=1 Tax=Pseudomonas sp. WS 5010 TaxID=2717489 RepID=UPI0014745862|nr:recombinase family protein [Pseudomonas sp. WS 5010]NMX89435.1 recombinase family protein [Pseudomonas sp. WS 5010]